jgi:hypothetical protein
VVGGGPAGSGGRLICESRRFRTGSARG